MSIIFKNKNHLCVLFILIQVLFSKPNFSQVSSENPEFLNFKDRIYYGGGIGLQFGTMTLIQVAPLIGYKINKHFSTGIRLNYLYLNDQRNDYSSNIYGGSVFGRFFIFNYLFIHGEYDLLNRNIIVPYTYKEQRVNSSAFLVGGGLNQNVAKNIYINLMILWNILEDSNYPYDNPIIRGGFSVGF